MPPLYSLSPERRTMMKFSTAIASILLLASIAATPTPVTDAQYTLLCQTFTGPTHAQSAKEAKDALIKATKLHDWYVVIGDTESNLYFGYYRSFDLPSDKDTIRAQNDRKTLAGMTEPDGSRPFQYCVFVPIAGADPSAPPEWDLRNAKGYFTLSIAAYMDSPMRKQYAVDAVRAARAQGVEAYYFHGEHASEVCIGAWPREAVREQESAGGRTNDPTEPILVSTTPLPANLRDLRTRDTGQKVKVLAPKPEYLDPTLIAAMKKYPTHSINGESVVRKYTKDGQDTEMEDPSFLVLIPAKEEVVKQDPVLEQRAIELGIEHPANTPQPGAGQLKSIGD
jgi:hypothetical protein